jgi:mannose-6-phosphate isomerase-like protein (cupin superfamily)
MSVTTEASEAPLPPADPRMLMAEAEMFGIETPDSFQQVPGFDGLEIRPLHHVEKYTGGKWGGVVLRRLRGTPFKRTAWHMHRLDMQFSYIVQGWILMELEGIGCVRLEAGASLIQPPLNRHRVLDASEDLVGIELNTPANFPTTVWLWNDEKQEYETVVIDTVSEAEVAAG